MDEKKEAKRLYDIEYRIKNKELIKEKSKIYIAKNIDKIKERTKKYMQDNKDVLREKQNIYKAKKRAESKAAIIKIDKPIVLGRIGLDTI